MESQLSRWCARLLVGGLLFGAIYYAASTVFSMWQYGWTEVFADQFRQYRKLLETPFPENLFILDNAHRQVISNLVRVADIRWGHGDQTIGVVAGIVVMLGLLVMMLCWIWRDQTRSVLFRAAATLLTTLALMWMGSARMQFHGNESFQIYLVMAGAVIALYGVERLRERPQAGWIVVALLAALVATLSFATGAAVFGLILAAMVIRRVAARWMLSGAAATVFVVAGYMYLLPGGEGVRGSLDFSPLPLVRHTATWLSSFWMTSWLGYADVGGFGVDAARMSQSFLGAPVVASAQWVSRSLGDPAMLDLALGVGAFGLLLLAVVLWRCWRAEAALPQVAVLGVGLAVFAAGVAVLVSLGRSGLFTAAPGQQLADRYVPWTALFWLGLALVLGTWLSRHRFGDAVFASMSLLLALLLYPSHWLGYGWAAAVEREVERRAAQLQVGVFEDGILTHCDLPNVEAVKQAIAVQRAHRVGIFRTPRSRLLHTVLSLPTADALDSGIIVSALQSVAEIASAAVPAWHVSGSLTEPSKRAGIDGLVVTSGDGRIVGLGEFGFRSPGGSRQRIDRGGDGFDVYLRADAGCSGLSLYGVDDAGQRFVGLGRLAHCQQRTDCKEPCR